mmetsp:Transcript_51513/g.137228  ORF Transcript_51513/g.137228 Transcript_51513/m.137228 type:complete len:211 (+) Transcript_51513:212-844(+)
MLDVPFWAAASARRPHAVHNGRVCGRACRGPAAAPRAAGPPSGALAGLPQPAAHLAREPVEPLGRTRSTRCAGLLDKPRLAPQAVQPKAVGHLRGHQSLWYVLLVRVDQHGRLLHLLLPQEVVQLLTGLLHPLVVGAVHDEDDADRARGEVAPRPPDLGLAADVPDLHVQAPTGEGLDVEAYRRHRRDRLVQLQPIQDGGLAGGVKPHHD